MLQIFSKKDGAITVFLSIILVPMIIVSCLFVDASRTKLAQGLVSSAGDLVLNTALTQYDPVLNDFYGLMASSQSVDEFLSVADDYFMACITSQGVDEVTAENLNSQISGLLYGTGGEVVDLLQMSAAEGGDFKVEEVKNGNLTNPAVIKKEIVEFMKYRTPINTITEVMDKIKENSKSLENAKDDGELTDKKQKYYESESDVVKICLEVYKKLLDYKELNIDADDIQEMKKYIDTVEDKYKEVHEKMVKDLYNTQNLDFNGSGIVYNPKIKSVNKKQINNYIDNAAKTMSEFEEIAAGVENLDSVIPEYDAGTMYPIQYWSYVEKILDGSSNAQKFARKANELIRNMKRLSMALDLLSDEEKGEIYNLHAYNNLDSAGEKTRKDHYDSLKKQYEKCAIFSNTCVYNRVCETLSQIKDTYKKDLDTSEANQTIADIYSKLKEYSTKYEEAYKVVGNAVSDLKNLKDEIKKYNNRLEDWKDKAESYESDLSKDDQDTIKTLETDIIDNVTEDNIDELIDRLNNIKSLLGSLKKAMKEYKYNGTSIGKINDYSTFRSKSGVNENKISYNNNELIQYVESSFHFQKSDTISKIGITENNNPAIHEVNTPKLYIWLMEKFKDYSPDKEDEKKKNEDEYEEAKKTGEEEVKGLLPGNYRDSKNNISGLSNLPSASKEKETVEDVISTNLSKVSKFVSGLFTDLGGTLGQTAVNMRDDLFVLDYVMSMFSYDTFEKEGVYKLSGGDTGKEGEAKNQWKSTEVTFTDNKTLTNKMIDTNYNYSYGSEVEYILYGNTNKKNMNSSYGSIFAVRYVMNLLPYCQRYMGNALNNKDFDKNVLVDYKALKEVAIGIQTATYGVVPEALFRLVVTLGLTAAESARDIKRLQSGKPLPILKDVKELETTFTPGTGYTPKEEEMKDGLYYSDYITLFLFLKLQTQADSIYLRIGDVIQANMAKQITGNTDYTLEKAKVYYKASVTVQVAPLMLELPIVTNNGFGSVLGDWNKITYEGVRGY